MSYLDGFIYFLDMDSTHIYCSAGTSSQKVYKLLKSDLSKVAESADQGAIIWDVWDDGTYIYAGGDADACIRYRKSDLSIVATGLYANNVYAIVGDTKAIYVAGGNNNVFKLAMNTRYNSYFERLV